MSIDIIKLFNTEKCHIVAIPRRLASERNGPQRLKLLINASSHLRR